MNDMLEQILHTVQTMDKRMENVKNDVRRLKEDVSGLKRDVSGLKQDVQELKKGQASIPAMQRAIFETNDPVKEVAKNSIKKVEEHDLAIQALNRRLLYVEAKVE